MDPWIEAAIANWSQFYGLPVHLVTAIIVVESSGNPYVTKHERHYRWLWNTRTHKPYRLDAGFATSSRAPNDFHGSGGTDAQTEYTHQKTSWSLMQVMGSVLREYGYRREFPAICGHEDAVRYGCLHLSTLKKRFFNDYGYEGVIAAYNAGHVAHVTHKAEFKNQWYVDKVIRRGGLG